MINKNEEKINNIDYVNNKADKIINLITSYNSYKFGGNVNDGNISVTATETPITLKNNMNYYGNTDFFKINDDNIEVQLPIVANDLGVAQIDFYTNFRATNFTAGEIMWGRITVTKADGTTRKQAFQSISVIGTSSRNEMGVHLTTTLEKGDKIYFEIAIDNPKTISVSKTNFFINYQQQLPTELYKFLY